jgi:nitrate reductase beta subunit
LTYDYQNLHNAPESKHQPIARPRSLITGKRMDKITWGPNWEELLGGEFENAPKTELREHAEGDVRPVRKHLHDVSAAPVRALPEPGCVATCPSGAIYKREEDGIVLIDQDKCRGWRVHHRLPVQENLLQLEERQIREMHLLLPAY